MKNFEDFPFRRRKKDEDPSVLAIQLSQLTQQISNGTGGSSGGALVYNTLTDLQNAYPNGSTQPAWVISDNEWYYWSGAILDTTAPNITCSSNGGTFSSAQMVTLSSNETATIYYTLDGSTPTTSSSVYSSALTISSTSTLKFFGKDTAGNSSTVQSVSFTITVSVPSDVTNLTTSNVSSTSTTLTWTASAAATSYDIYNGSTLLGNTTNTNYQVTALSASTAYTFKVVAKNSGGSSAGITVNVTTLATAPNPVTNLAAGNVTYNSIPVTWSYTNGSDVVSNFEVAYSSDGGNSYTVSSSVVNSNSISYTVTGLSSSTPYVIRVVAVDASGNRSTASTINVTTSAIPDTTPPVITASPVAGTYTSSQSVTLTSNETATIYYTTDGTTPTTASTVYTSPISISATTTLQYIGKDPAGNLSTPVTATYTIGLVEGTHTLHMSGNSYFNTPASMPTYNKVEISMKGSTNTGYILDNRTAIQEYLLNGFAPQGISGMTVNGSAIANDNTWQNGIPVNNTRYTLDITLSANITGLTHLFNKNTTNDQAFVCDVYFVKIYNGSTLVAWYDFTNQFAGNSVTDQSGNGNTGTISGGTWN